MLGRVLGPFYDMEALFGVPGGSEESMMVDVVVFDLSGTLQGKSAEHFGCNFIADADPNSGGGGVLWLDTTTGFITKLPDGTLDPASVVYAADVETALYVAEVSEDFMCAQKAGWDPSASNGEGLSRFLAQVDNVSGANPEGLVTGPAWVSAGYPDYVNITDPTDGNPESIGCAVLYLFWMLSLGYTKRQIIQAGGAILARNYQALTGKNTAYADLKAAVQPAMVTSDNPFGAVKMGLMRHVGQNSDGRLEVFACGTDNALWHNWQTAPGGNWSGWAPLGGGLTSEPEVAANLDGRLEVFIRGTDTQVWHNWQVEASGAWSGWAPLGGTFTSGPTVARNGDGRLEVFIRGTDFALWHSWQLEAGGAWSDWESLGGSFADDPAVVLDANDLLWAFSRGTDNELHYNSQRAQQLGGGWSGWAPMSGALAGDPATALDRDGWLEVFARGADGALWHNWQVPPGGGWSGWTSMGAPAGTANNAAAVTSDPAVVLSGDTLQLFVRGADNQLWANSQEQPVPGSAWSGWTSLGAPTYTATDTSQRPPAAEVFTGGLTSDPVVGINSAGSPLAFTMMVFARASDSALHYIPQNDLFFGGWAEWTSLGANPVVIP
jgi:hypothetical protein